MKHVSAIPVLVTAFLTGPSLFEAQSPQSRDTTVRRTTVCDVVQDIAKYDGVRVRLRAAFESDGLEHSVLVDSKCKRGLIPFNAEGAENREGVRALDEALSQGSPGTIDKTVIATFVGRVKWKKTPPRSTFILEIEDVEDLTVTPKTSGKTSPATQS